METNDRLEQIAAYNRLENLKISYAVEVQGLLKDHLSALSEFSADFRRFDHEGLITAATSLLTHGIHALRYAILYTERNVSPEDVPGHRHLLDTLRFAMGKTRDALIGGDPTEPGLVDLLGLHYTETWPQEARPYARCGDAIIYAYDCDDGGFYGNPDTKIAGDMFYIWHADPQRVRLHLTSVLGIPPETSIEVLPHAK